MLVSRKIFALLLSPPDDVLSKTADLNHFKKNEKKGEIESYLLNTLSGGLKLNYYLVQYDFDPMI